MANRIFQSVFGIQTGDLVTTSYATGPYEVWGITVPRYTQLWVGRFVIRDYPVISLTLIAPGVPPRGDNGLYWINDVRQEGERYLTDANDEVFVRRGSPIALPIDFLRSYPATPGPYPFDPTVDFGARPRRIWRCTECRRDFNAVVESRHGPAYCPGCQKSWCVEEISIARRPGLP
jgi:hypothetical protein